MGLVRAYTKDTKRSGCWVPTEHAEDTEEEGGSIAGMADLRLGRGADVKVVGLFRVFRVFRGQLSGFVGAILVLVENRFRVSPRESRAAAPAPELDPSA
jgi:hypothetical protein